MKFQELSIRECVDNVLNTVDMETERRRLNLNQNMYSSQFELIQNFGCVLCLIYLTMTFRPQLELVNYAANIWPGREHKMAQIFWDQLRPKVHAIIL